MADEKYSAESNGGFGFGPYRPAGHVDVSAGTEMPSGILSMKPLLKGNVTMAERGADNSTPNRITPELKTRLTTMNPEIAQRVRAVVARKP